MNYGKKKAAKRQKKITSKSTMQGKRIVVRLFKALLICIVLAAVVGMAGGGLFIKNIIDDTPHVSTSDVKPKGFTTFVYAMTEALRLNVLYLLVPIEYTSLLMRYRKIFNMLLLQSRMSVFISITV